MQNAGYRRSTIVSLGPALAFFAAMILVSPLKAQSLEEIRDAVVRSREAIESLDVRVEFVEVDLRAEKKNESVTSVERFAFEGDNRRLERWNFDPTRNDPGHSVTLLGTRGYQRMYDGDRKSFGRRETCSSAAFALVRFSYFMRWAIPDPTMTDENERQMLTHHDLELVLQSGKYHVAKREGNLVTLQGDPNPPREASAAVGAPIPDDIPPINNEIVLDADMAYAVRSTINTVETLPDCFYEVRNEDFREVLPGVWLPHQGEEEEKSPKRHVVTKWRVVELHVNDVDDALFEETLIPFSTFVDLDGPRDIQSRGIPASHLWEKAENFERSRGPYPVRR